MFMAALLKRKSDELLIDDNPKTFLLIMDFQTTNFDKTNGAEYCLTSNKARFLNKDVNI